MSIRSQVLLGLDNGALLPALYLTDLSLHGSIAILLIGQRMRRREIKSQTRLDMLTHSPRSKLAVRGQLGNKGIPFFVSLDQQLFTNNCIQNGLN